MQFLGDVIPMLHGILQEEVVAQIKDQKHKKNKINHQRHGQRGRYQYHKSERRNSAMVMNRTMRWISRSCCNHCSLRKCQSRSRCGASPCINAVSIYDSCCAAQRLIFNPNRSVFRRPPCASLRSATLPSAFIPSSVCAIATKRSLINQSNTTTSRVIVRGFPQRDTVKIKNHFSSP